MRAATVRCAAIIPGPIWRHLFKADEVLALRLAVLHNLYFYNDLMVKIRAALDEGTFADFRARYSGELEKRA